MVTEVFGTVLEAGTLSFRFSESTVISDRPTSSCTGVPSGSPNLGDVALSKADSGMVHAPASIVVP